MEIALLTTILAAAIFLLITQIIRIELTALLIIVALSVTRLLEPEEALSGISDDVTITVAGMLMLSAGLVRTGALDYLVRLAGKLRVSGPAALILIVGVIAAVLSAFLTNTGVVIMLIPVVLRLCQKNNLMPSKVMIPLSYFAIFGGTLTLIGTSTNILVDGMFRESGGSGFGMFEFTPMGVCYLILGGTFLFFFSDKVLPERKVLSQVLERRHRTNFVTEIVVQQHSPFAGKTLHDLLVGFEGVKILELVREEDVTLRPELDTRVQGEDMLLIEGSPQTIHRMLEKQGLDLASAVEDDRRVKISRIDLVTVEAVVTPNSQFFNQRLRDIGLNRLYDIKVLAIQRMGRHLQVRLREMKLQVGDVILIQGEQRALQQLEATANVLLIEGVEKTIHFSRMAPLAVGVLVAVIAVAALRVLPLSVAVLGGSAAMMLFRCLRIREALAALDSAVLLLLAAALPLGIAMEKTGLAGTMARSILGLAQDFGPVVLIAVLYLITSVLTAFLTNVATAALLVPIVLQIALDLGVDAKPLLIAVTFGASASFFTPIGYQTNLLVMGPGGYKFRDYLRIGLLINLILWVAATVLIPVFWSF
ncbi:MAG: SLC13 family permease [Candidatus Krumholzibacteriia bacterium]